MSRLHSAVVRFFYEADRKTRVRLWLLIVLSIIVTLLATIVPPVPQPHSYHQFADQRNLLGIPNFMNVTSNLAFLLSGLAGLVLLWYAKKVSSKPAGQQRFMTIVEYWPYLVLFISVAMVAPGSAYYHWEPNNVSLLWDRLPIAVGVGALLAAVLSERINPMFGLWALPVLVIMGAGSVIYWFWSEQQGYGNLNYYIVVQFYSLLLIVLFSLLQPSHYNRGGDIYVAVGLYATAKLAEIFDQQIFDLGGVVSGHTIKHLLAALAILWIVRMLLKRKIVVAFDEVHPLQE